MTERDLLDWVGRELDSAYHDPGMCERDLAGIVEIRQQFRRKLKELTPSAPEAQREGTAMTDDWRDNIDLYCPREDAAPSSPAEQREPTLTPQDVAEGRRLRTLEREQAGYINHTSRMFWRWMETNADALLSAAERLPRLEAQVEQIQMLSGTEFLDPPDGGDVSIVEQITRMRTAYVSVCAQLAASAQEKETLMNVVDAARDMAEWIERLYSQRVEISLAAVRGRFIALFGAPLTAAPTPSEGRRYNARVLGREGEAFTPPPLPPRTRRREMSEMKVDPAGLIARVRALKDALWRFSALGCKELTPKEAGVAPMTLDELRTFLEATEQLAETRAQVEQMREELKALVKAGIDRSAQVERKYTRNSSSFDISEGMNSTAQATLMRFNDLFPAPAHADTERTTYPKSSPSGE